MTSQSTCTEPAQITRVRQFWVVGINDEISGLNGVSLEEMWEYEQRIFGEDYPIVENQWPAEAPLDIKSLPCLASLSALP
jgi:hypothetical protein